MPTRTSPQKLPAPVLRQIARGAEIQRQVEQHEFKHPKPGPKPLQREIGIVPVLSANSEAELNNLIQCLSETVGPVRKGNGRLGRVALYADLVQHFHLLKERGVTLPRNKSLSAKACSYGLGEMLRKHGCTEFSDNELENNGQKRGLVASRMDRVFSRVSRYVENPPRINPEFISQADSG